MEAGELYKRKSKIKDTMTRRVDPGVSTNPPNLKKKKTRFGPVLKKLFCFKGRSNTSTSHCTYVRHIKSVEFIREHVKLPTNISENASHFDQYFARTNGRMIGREEITCTS